MHMRKQWWLGGGALLALAALIVPGIAFAQSQQTGSVQVRPFDHVFVIFMENHGTPSIIGDPNAPFINQLASQNTLATNYFGVTHPSLPNYVAATSGNNWYSNSDNPTQVFDHTNLVDELEQAHKSWKAYMEDLPSVGFTGAQSTDGMYVNKHNPFVLYKDVLDSPQRLSHVVPLDQLSQDLAANTVPNFSWITPNVCNDMHGEGAGACPYSNDALLKQDGDAFVQHWVTAITHSKAWTGNSVIFIAWDENDYTGNSADGGWANANGCCDSPVVPAGASFFPAGGVYGGGEVPMIVVGTQVKHHFTTSVAYNHYSMLKTIEAGWHLPYMGMTADGAQVHAMSDVFTFGG